MLYIAECVVCGVYRVLRSVCRVYGELGITHCTVDDVYGVVLGVCCVLRNGYCVLYIAHCVLYIT